MDTDDTAAYVCDLPVNPADDERRMTEFEKGLEDLINRHSLENGSDTPDFILAHYLRGCLEAFNAAVTRRTQWYAP